MIKVRGKNLTSREAARLLGVSEASVKRWADSGLLPTQKTAGGHRRFRPEDVAVFKRSGSDSERPRAAVRELTKRRKGKSAEATAPRKLRGEKALVEETFRTLLDGRAEELSALFINLHLNGQTVASIADRCLCPPLRRIGDLWHRGELSVAQEHVATRTAMSALRSLQSATNASEERRMLALCCSVEDDFHELPVQLAALTLEACGLEVFHLGTSTPFFALSEASERFRPRLICVAATVLNGLDRAAREYSEFHKTARRAGVAVVLGGAGFANAEVRKRLPADLHAESFLQLERFAAGLSP